MRAVNTTRWLIFVLLCFTVSVLLSACDGEKHGDLRKHVQRTLARPGTKIEPLPTIEPYKSHHYSVKHLRSPFEPPRRTQANNSNIRPDVNRPKEELEKFALDSLQMVGTLGSGKDRWALIMAPDGGVYRITTGNYIGKNYGRVISVTTKNMTIMETVSNGQGGWTHREQKLALQVNGDE